MSWTSSPKDSIAGLTLLLFFGGALTISIAIAAWSAVTDVRYEVVPGWALVGVLIFIGSAYAAVYATTGLLRRVRTSYLGRKGPAFSAVLETAAAVLAWGTAVSILFAPNVIVVAVAFLVALTLKLAGFGFRRGYKRTIAS